MWSGNLPDFWSLARYVVLGMPRPSGWLFWLDFRFLVALDLMHDEYFCHAKRPDGGAGRIESEGRRLVMFQIVEVSQKAVRDVAKRIFDGHGEGYHKSEVRWIFDGFGDDLGEQIQSWYA